MTPLQQRQQDVTTATNDLQLATQKWGADSGQAAGAAVELKDKQQALADLQARLAAATNGTSIAVETNNQRLQGLANAASAANTQINLLKGALDALTGKAVTMDQAEIAVTQAVRRPRRRQEQDGRAGRSTTADPGPVHAQVECRRARC
jgi:DNA repair exonuclease SbcCD ATPase subunit